MNRPALSLSALAISATVLLAQSDILPGSSGQGMCPGEGAPAVLLQSALAGLNASAGVAIRIHRSNNPDRYAVDFVADYSFGGPVTITAFQVRSGVAGQSGAIVLDSGISSAAPVQSLTGSGTIQMQTAGLASANISAALDQVVNNPGQYYAEIDTGANPSGSLRGQLAQAQQSVAMGLMSPLNETPQIGSAAAATGTVVATITRGASGAISSAEVIFDVNYQFPSAVTLTGLQLQAGAAGVNGSVVLALNLGNTAAVGTGNIRMQAEMDLSQPAVVAALEALFADPSNYYLNLLTSGNPGAMRAQLARASRSVYETGACQMGTRNGDFADLSISLDVLRSATGDVQAGMVTFDADYVAQPNTSFVYFGIPPEMVRTSLSTSNPPTSATGLGSIYELVTVSSSVGLQQLENILLGLQEGVELLTANGITISGSIPLFDVGMSKLEIDNIQTGAGDPSALPAAPGGLITLFGTFPAGIPDSGVTDVTSLYNQAWPTSLNETWITIGDRNIPIGYHSLSQINAQAPADLAPGTYDVRYWVSRDVAPLSGISSQDQPDYRSDPFILTVAPQAPAIFVTGAGPVITHAATGLPVSASQPAVAGETILVYATGVSFGQTIGVIGTAPVTGPVTGPPLVSATIGATSVTASLVAPAYGIQGVQIFALTVPPGITGAQTLTLFAAGTASNKVQLAVQ